MKKLLFLAASALFFAGCGGGQNVDSVDVLTYVDPNIGSVHGRFFLYTPASAPWGMSKLAPHTNAYGSPGGWDPCGYDDRHESIEGFGQYHEFQIGGIVAMPTVGELKTLPGKLDNPDAGYRSRFQKANETAEAGYYSVLLDDYNVKAELTSTERVGFHRYTFPASDQSNILFDIGHNIGESGPIVDTYVKYNPESNEIEGWAEYYPVYATFCDIDKNATVYFVAKLDKTPAVVGTFRDSIQYAGQPEITGKGTGIYLTFPTTEGEQVNMQVGLSFTGIDGARKNLVAEATGMDFDKVRTATQNEWRKQLNKIKVEGNNEVDKVKFYTGLYHVVLGRGVSSDADGKYIRNDKTIAQKPLDKDGKPLYRHFNTDGIWGGFWNLTQLWAIAYPEYYKEYCLSLLDFYKERGWLHDGLAAGVYTNGVQTNYMGLILCSAVELGIITDQPTIDLIFEAAYKNDMGWENRDLGSGRFDNELFVKNGYIGNKKWVYPGTTGWIFDFGVSHTLEYSYSAYATAELAKRLGKTEEYNKLLPYANAFRNVYNKETNFVHPRDEKTGEFVKNYDPMQPFLGFQEGNGFQYTWYFPQDVAGLIELMGQEEFNNRLENQFVESRKFKFAGGDDEEIHSFSGTTKPYNQGNQPCLNQPWMFNYSGKPWLTQLYTRAIMNEFYGTEALRGFGVGQDEDQGQLGAWFDMVAMGLFDVQGHTRMNPTYQISAPLFDKITVQLDPAYYGGKELIIEGVNNGPENFYVQSANLNGKDLTNCWFDRADLMNGGKLTINLGPEPNTAWGVGTPPPSMSTDK